MSTRGERLVEFQRVEGRRPAAATGRDCPDAGRHGSAARRPAAAARRQAAARAASSAGRRRRRPGADPRRGQPGRQGRAARCPPAPPPSTRARPRAATGGAPRAWRRPRRRARPAAPASVRRAPRPRRGNRRRAPAPCAAPSPPASPSPPSASVPSARARDGQRRRGRAPGRCGGSAPARAARSARAPRAPEKSRKPRSHRLLQLERRVRPDEDGGDVRLDRRGAAGQAPQQRRDRALRRRDQARGRGVTDTAPRPANPRPTGGTPAGRAGGRACRARTRCAPGSRRKPDQMSRAGDVALAELRVELRHRPSSAARPSSGRDWSAGPGADARAARRGWRSRRRLPPAVTSSTAPSTRTLRRSDFQWKHSAAWGLARSSSPLRLSRLV